MANKKKRYTSYRVVENGAKTKKPEPPKRKEPNPQKENQDNKDNEVK